MNKKEIHLGGIHHVQVPTFGLVSGKIVEQIGKYYLCKKESNPEVFYLISTNGKLKMFPIVKTDLLDIEQYFTDGVFIIEDQSPDLPKAVFFDSYELKENVLHFTDIIHRKQIELSIN